MVSTEKQKSLLKLKAMPKKKKNNFYKYEPI